MKKYQVMYNPLSGNGTGEQAIEKLKQVLPDDELILTDVMKVQDMKAFILGLPEDTDPVLIGGDGTLNFLANALGNEKMERPIYFFPAGTGNDFLRDIGYAEDGKPVQINPYLCELPTVVVEGEYKHEMLFMNGIGYGIDGYCCEEGDRIRAKGTNKPINYTAIAIKGLLFKYKPTSVRYRVDGGEWKEFKKVWLAPTMNGRYYGGGIQPAPQQDRLNPERTVSLMVFHGKGRLTSLMRFPSIFEGKHIKYTDMVEIEKGHDIEVEFDRPTPLQVDGETFLKVRKYTVHTYRK